MSSMMDLDQLRTNLGEGWVVLEQRRRADGVAGLLAVLFGRGRGCVRVVSFFLSLFVSLLEGKTVKLTFHL